MADQNAKPSARRISPDERFHYIGFDVFPGKPPDLFKSDAEKQNFVKAVVDKRSRRDFIRDHCSLLIERVSSLERLVLITTSVLILLSLFLPWYSAYNEIVEKPAATSVSGQTPQNAAEEGVEVISALRSQQKVRKETSTMWGIGALIAFGDTVGNMLSSGFILILTALLMLGYTLACAVLPVRTLKAIFTLKGNPDEVALKLKQLLRFNWIPVMLLAAAFVFSFFGADYGFSAQSTFTSLGTSYGPGVFLGTLSWGLLVSLCGFILQAVKAIEI